MLFRFANFVIAIAVVLLVYCIRLLLFFMCSCV